jgi:hypothetical protein
MDPSTSNASEADLQCHLLNLPGELRNMIYGYALTDPKGLQYRRGNDHLGRFCNRTANAVTPADGGAPADAGAPHDADHEANQLQYVCHELRYETRGLGFRLNELHFKDYLDASLFIRSLPASMCKHIKVMHIDWGYPYTYNRYTGQTRSSGMLTVMQFCAAYSQVTVRARTAELKPWFHDILSSVVDLQAVGEVELICRVAS